MHGVDGGVFVGIESSCDDTCLATMLVDGSIIFNLSVTNSKLYQSIGGVVPEVASREHLTLIHDALKKLELNKSCNVVAVAATAGPGLLGGLIVGTMVGKGLASALKVPFVAVNHLEGHLLVSNAKFPFLGVLVSGGHCQIVLAKDIGNYEIIGQTLDDAVGEAFDKIGRELGLGYPAGATMDKLAQTGDPNKFKIAVPMMNSKSLDMSFSGLKTSAIYLLRKLEKPLNQQTLADFCASVQNAIVKALSTKVAKAVDQAKVKHLVIGGGVAANSSVRRAMEQIAVQNNITLTIPPLSLCTDNAVMIANVARLRYLHGEKFDIDTLSFAPRANWPLTEVYFK